MKVLIPRFDIYFSLYHECVRTASLVRLMNSPFYCIYIIHVFKIFRRQVEACYNDTSPIQNISKPLEFE